MAEATTPKSDKQEAPLSSAANKDAAKPSRPDHGKPSQWQLDQEKAQKEAAKDPWGTTPAQSRVEVKEPEEKAFAYDGLNPHLDNNEHVVGGTLPPV